MTDCFLAVYVVYPQALDLGNQDFLCVQELRLSYKQVAVVLLMLC